MKEQQKKLIKIMLIYISAFHLKILALSEMKQKAHALLYKYQGILGYKIIWIF